MSQVLEGERARVPVRRRIPVRRRRPILDSTLIIMGALAALAGLYFQFAPSDWWLAHFSEMYQFGSYTLGGLSLGPGSACLPTGPSRRTATRRHGRRPA